MNSAKHYTDEELQEVLDNTFTGDLSLFHAHLAECTECKNHFDTYSFIKASVHKEDVVFDKTATVINRTWGQLQQERKANLFDVIQYWIIVVTGTLLVLLCLFFLSQLGIGLPAMILVFVFIAGFLFVSYKEVKVVDSNWNAS